MLVLSTLLICLVGNASQQDILGGVGSLVGQILGGVGSIVRESSSAKMRSRRAGLQSPLPFPQQPPPEEVPPNGPPVVNPMPFNRQVSMLRMNSMPPTEANRESLSPGGTPQMSFIPPNQQGPMLGMPNFNPQQGMLPPGGMQYMSPYMGMPPAMHPGIMPYGNAMLK